MVKNLALMSHITTEVDEYPLIRLANNAGMSDIRMASGMGIHSIDTFFVLLNGNILGTIRNYKKFINTFRKMRRSGYISSFVSIYPSMLHHCIYISSDGGRLCRPYFIVENGKLLVTQEHITALEMKLRSFDDFVHDGNLFSVRINNN